MSEKTGEKIRIAEQEQRESHLRVNKFLAERDPFYEEKYHNKRSLILAQILSAEDEVKRMKLIYESKQRKHNELIKSLVSLDQARKNWEPM